MRRRARAHEGEERVDRRQRREWREKGWMYESDAFDVARRKKMKRKREGFKTPVLVSRGEQQK